ncbi:DUF3618 domain-containing protein [Knoellia sp. CPCC 206450]|uniref:DUF3618 domain-containing protein n=1 Tax=Knoellia tibetensis TaxID=3404798 RepID=UPI003B42A481
MTYPTDPHTTTPVSSDDPEAIRREIERTRGRLSQDVDTLGETVRPGNVAHRTAETAKGKLSSVKDSVMGSAHDVQSTGGNAVSSVTDTASDLPKQARSKARGNPFAAGAVAMGLGWLVGSLMPASEKERELVSTAKEQAQPLVDEVKSVAQDVAQDLKEPASEAARAVKDTAQSGAQEVKDQGQTRAQDVKASAQDSGA